MRIKVAAALVAVSVLAGGCAGTPAGDALRVATATVANPVDANDIYAAENAYAVALELAVEYRRYCWARPYKVLMADPIARPVCERRREVVRLIQRYRPAAGTALAEAKAFVAQNPTLSAAGVIGAAWTAIRQFQAAVPAVKA